MTWNDLKKLYCQWYVSDQDGFFHARQSGTGSANFVQPSSFVFSFSQHFNQKHDEKEFFTFLFFYFIGFNECYAVADNVKGG